MKDVAQLMKALADETRLQMLWLLFHHRELCVCDLMEALDITQSKASRHLATLRHAGLVSDRREGAWSYYSIRPTESPLTGALLGSLRAGLSEHPEAEAVLESLHAWMEHKDRQGSCAASRPRPKPSKAPPRGASPRKRPRSLHQARRSIP